MKIRVTLNVTDDARRCIAANMKRTAMPYLSTQAGTATRATVIKYLEGVLATAHFNYDPQPKLDPLEREETARAVEQLRAIGWPDSRIKLWLLKNSALMEGAKLKLWDAPLLTTQPAIMCEVEKPAAKA